jgi:hypothetical protein
MNLVLAVLGKADIRINSPKCTFHTKKIEFLGYIMGSEKIKIDPKKTQAIRNWLIP